MIPEDNVESAKMFPAKKLKETRIMDICVKAYLLLKHQDKLVVPKRQYLSNRVRGEDDR